MKTKKYKLSHSIKKGLIITSLAVALATVTTPLNIENIPYTQEDLSNNIYFNNELTKISSSNEIIINNQEIYNILVSLVGEPLTKDKLSNITELTINHLDNNDLSDLKYLPNLYSITINDNDLNLQDLQYNQNLYYLEINNCTLHNTEYLPNSIEGLFIYYSSCSDNRFITPYYCKSLAFVSTSFNNLTLKNPSILENFILLGDAILDLNTFKDCLNLKEIYLLLCSNISNPYILTELPNLETIELDDYCPIWLNNEILEQLPLSNEDKIIYGDEITKLDNIANDLLKDNLSNEDKIRYITIYILEKLKYDENVLNSEEENIDLVHEYNLEPIKKALTEENAVCINYACLFKALANRLGLINYQLYSDNHTWNLIYQDNELKCYDLTNLDSDTIAMINNELCIIADATSSEIIKDGKEDILYFYNFDPDEIKLSSYEWDNFPTQAEDTLVNIGYINNNSLVKIVYKNKIRATITLKTLSNILCLSLLNYAFNYKSRQKEESNNLNLTK